MIAEEKININIKKSQNSRIKEIDFSNLVFGKHLSDHMFVSDWEKGKWSNMAIVPYGQISFCPSMVSLHYGQMIFEGMKAFKRSDGKICIFRPQKHHDRLNKSLERMCMPSVPFDLFIQSLQSLVEIDKAWIPSLEGGSLYIRPLIFATDEKLGVSISNTYKFVVITSPSGKYFSKPSRLKLESHFTRTAEGGPGFAKCAGNYGGALYPTKIATQEGFDQLLWTDHKEHKYIDEVGMMNVMFVINGKLITPMLSSAILDGITRDSILTLAKHLGIQVEERKVSVDELVKGFSSNTLTEAFGTGTAAVVSPIAEISISGVNYKLPPIIESSIQTQLQNKLIKIIRGDDSDSFNWNYIF